MAAVWWRCSDFAVVVRVLKSLRRREDSFASQTTSRTVCRINFNSLKFSLFWTMKCVCVARIRRNCSSRKLLRRLDNISITNKNVWKYANNYWWNEINPILFCIYTSIRLEIVYTVSCRDSVVKFHRKTNFDDNGLMTRLEKILLLGLYILFLTSKMWKCYNF